MIINTSTPEGKPQNFEPRFFNPCNDVAFKKVFQHEALTISFLNSTLRLTGERQIKHIAFLPTEQLPITAEAKKSILDVLCTDHRGFRYIIEVQNKYMNNYIQRVQYYVAHLYADQLAQTSNYLELKPVTLLSLLNHTIFPPEINYLSYHQNIETETRTSYLNDMSYAFVELPKFTKTLGELMTDEDHWIYMMKHATDMREAPQGAPEAVRQAYDILERHTWTTPERLAYEQAKIGLMDDLDTLQTAREEGKKASKLEMAQKMLNKQKTVEEIIEFTDLTAAEIAQLKASL